MLINPATVVVFVLFILSLHSRFRGLGQFCLDNKIMRLGSFFFIITHHTLFHYRQQEMLCANQQGKSTHLSI